MLNVKRVVLVFVIVLLMISCRVFVDVSFAYNHKLVGSYISYRIGHIHDVAYNTNVDLSMDRIESYSDNILYWSDYYSREYNVEINPLLITAILETETNFVSRSDYDGGDSIGICSMQITTAKWLSEKLGLKYNKWRMLDPNDLGIRLMVYYIALGFEVYGNDPERVIISYNQGFGNANGKNIDNLYNEYLFKVLGRLRYYENIIRQYKQPVYFDVRLAQIKQQ